MWYSGFGSKSCTMHTFVVVVSRHSSPARHTRWGLRADAPDRGRCSAVVNGNTPVFVPVFDQVDKSAYRYTSSLSLNWISDHGASPNTMLSNWAILKTRWQPWREIVHSKRTYSVEEAQFYHTTFILSILHNGYRVGTWYVTLLTWSPTHA